MSRHRKRTAMFPGPQESSRTMAPEPAQGQDNRPNISGRRAELFSAATDTGGDAIPQMAVVSTHGVHTQRTKMSSTTGEELIFTATQAIRHGPDGFTRTRKPARTVISDRRSPDSFLSEFRRPSGFSGFCRQMRLLMTSRLLASDRCREPCRRSGIHVMRSGVTGGSGGGDGRPLIRESSGDFPDPRPHPWWHGRPRD